jgi:hypothetical protein
MSSATNRLPNVPVASSADALLMPKDLADVDANASMVLLCRPNRTSFLLSDSLIPVAVSMTVLPRMPRPAPATAAPPTAAMPTPLK